MKRDDIKKYLDDLFVELSKAKTISEIELVEKKMYIVRELVDIKKYM